MPQSIRAYIEELKSEKFRAFIIHSKNELKTSKFLKKASDELSAKYINLLRLFEEDPDLSDSLDFFSSSKLFDLLKTISKGENILFVDDISFLWDTWDEKERRELLLMVEKQWNSFQIETKATLVFNLPEDYILLNYTIKDTRGRSRIKDINEFSAII